MPPTTFFNRQNLTFLGAGLNFLGAGLGIAGGVRRGNEAVRNATVNAELILQNLEVTRTETRSRIRDIHRQFRALRGRQIAAAGVSGVKAGTGSTLLATIEATREERLAILREKFRLDVAEAFEPFRAQEVRRAGDIARTEQILGGVGRAISGAFQAATFLGVPTK